jgi:uncharacterized protein (TIGR02678 family)
VSTGLETVLESTRREELRRGACALLRRPLLRASGPDSEDFLLVRRHADALREWFDINTGWRLVVDSEVARLVKRVPSVADASHPARDARSRLPFSRRRYVLLCLALAVLERSDVQITLGRLAEGVIHAAADGELVRAGVTFGLEGREERSDLVAVVRLLLELGVLARVAGDEEAFVREAGDVLYDVARPALALLLAAPRGPSTIAADRFEDRLVELAREPVPVTEELRTRAIRHHLTRRLLDEPVVYHAELDESHTAYLATQRAALVRRIAELTGLVAEIRAEGIAMVDPRDDLTDVRMPDTGTDGHVTLLLAERLATALASRAGAAEGAGGTAEVVPEARLHDLVRGLAREHQAYWRRDAQEPDAEVALTERALERLEALRLVRREHRGVRPLPALARYAVAAPMLAGVALEEQT